MLREEVDLADVRPGDWADHRSGELDPRPITGLSPETKEVVIQIGRIEIPVPEENYRFYRLTPQ